MRPLRGMGRVFRGLCGFKSLLAPHAHMHTHAPTHTHTRTRTQSLEARPSGGIPMERKWRDCVDRGGREKKVINTKLNEKQRGIDWETFQSWCRGESAHNRSKKSAGTADFEWKRARLSEVRRRDFSDAAVVWFQSPCCLFTWKPVLHGRSAGALTCTFESRFEYEGKDFTQEPQRRSGGMSADLSRLPSFFFQSASVLRVWGCLRVAPRRLQLWSWPVSAPWCWWSRRDSARSCGSASGSPTDWWPRKCWRRTVRGTRYLWSSSRAMGPSSRMWRTSNRWEVAALRTNRCCAFTPLFWLNEDAWIN